MPRIAAEYDDCERTGRKPPNVNETEGVKERLRKKGLSASGKQIRELMGDERYDGRRLQSRALRPARTSPLTFPD